MVQTFDSKEKAERAAKNVNEYLDEQAMYLHTEVVKLEDGRFAVAIVNCY